MSRPKIQPQANELPVYVANARWFMMFSAEIQNNLVAKMTPNVFAIWVVMRAHADINTGKVFLSTSDFERLTGLSRKTVLGAVSKLASESHIQIVSEGKQKRRYFVVDVVKFHAVGSDIDAAKSALEAGSHTGQLAVRYVPKTATQDRVEVTRFLSHGEQPSSANVTMHVESGATVNVNHVERLEQHLHLHVSDPELQQRLKHLMVLAAERKITIEENQE